MRLLSNPCCERTNHSDAGIPVSQTVEVTRYPNRRLYDRSQRQYVTLGDIEELVRSGKQVRVRDSKTQEDLTRVVLTQILLERHPERLQMFPVALLHEILRADQMALDWLKVYLGQTKSFIESLPSASASDFVPGMDLWKLWMPGAALRPESSSETEAEPDEEPPREAGQRQDRDEEDHPSQSEREMAKRLAELEQRLIQLEASRD